MLPPINWPSGLDAAQFVRDYWQQRPLLIRNAFPGFTNPLSADELAGLACEPEVPSRLVIESRGAHPWELREGPFDAQTFDWLGTEGWSLMVTDLEKLLPDLRTALQPFRFIPDWRIDDLMASFAPTGGSVGPHYDAYDVFLFQAEGRRRWHIGPESESGYRLLHSASLRIIEDPVFDCEHELEPGDMLYLPPRYAHHGVALEPCITWSFGFRAPAIGDLIAAWGDNVSSDFADDCLHTDPGFDWQANPGAIARETRERLRQRVEHALTGDPAAFDLFLGRYLTDRAVDEPLEADQLTAADLAEMAAGGRILERHPAIRFAYVEQDDRATLFAGGVAFTTHLAAAQAVCDDLSWRGDALHRLLGVEGTTELLIALAAMGFLESRDAN